MERAVRMPAFFRHFTQPLSGPMVPFAGCA